MDEHTALWEKAKAILMENLPSVSYETWIDQPLKPIYVDGDEMAIEVISDFVEKTVRPRYLVQI